MLHLGHGTKPTKQQGTGEDRSQMQRKLHPLEGIVAICALFFVLALSVGFAQAREPADAQKVRLRSASVLVQDAESGEVVYMKNSEAVVPVLSVLLARELGLRRKSATAATPPAVFPSLPVGKAADRGDSSPARGSGRYDAGTVGGRFWIRRIVRAFARRALLRSSRATRRITLTISPRVESFSSATTNISPSPQRAP